MAPTQDAASCAGDTEAKMDALRKENATLQAKLDGDREAHRARDSKGAVMRPELARRSRRTAPQGRRARSEARLPRRCRAEARGHREGLPGPQARRSRRDVRRGRLRQRAQKCSPSGEFRPTVEAKQPESARTPTRTRATSSPVPRPSSRRTVSDDVPDHVLHFRRRRRHDRRLLRPVQPRDTGVCSAAVGVGLGVIKHATSRMVSPISDVTLDVDSILASGGASSASAQVITTASFQRRHRHGANRPRAAGDPHAQLPHGLGPDHDDRLRRGCRRRDHRGRRPHPGTAATRRSRPRPRSAA